MQRKVQARKPYVLHFGIYRVAVNVFYFKTEISTHPVPLRLLLLLFKM